MPTWTVTLLFNRKGAQNGRLVFEGKQRRVATQVYRNLSVALEAMGVTCRLRLCRDGIKEEEYRINETTIQ